MTHDTQIKKEYKKLENIKNASTWCNDIPVL